MLSVKRLEELTSLASLILREEEKSGGAPNAAANLALQGVTNLGERRLDGILVAKLRPTQSDIERH